MDERELNEYLDRVLAGGREHRPSDAYERLNRELAAHDWPDMNHYAEAKGPFIESVLAKSDAPVRQPKPGSPGNE